ALVAAIRAVRPEVVVHVDAVQALGKCSVSWSAWGVDLLSISAHKVGGPMGVGALVHARGRAVEPRQRGGQQERGRRGGTEAVGLVHGFGLAAELAAAEQASRFAHTHALRARLAEGLQARGARIHGDPERHTGNTLNVAWAGCSGELVMMALDLQGFAVSTGAACSAGLAEPSPVLLALGQAPDRAREAVRLSLHHTNTEAHVDALLDALDEVLPRIRAAGPPLRSAS
ncbi:MAG: aminotransferase class V-fold PLP-dependent enzyme, partial [Myxococcales bacterium]|nr:aminotransferase class V-fold PLP-dependent enzyme [Myxococcales bacterium]